MLKDLIPSTTSQEPSENLNATHFFCTTCKALHKRGIEGHQVMKTGWIIYNRKVKINVGICEE